ncbi:MAG: hypothetical protein ACREN7_04635 [Candidatus Dormibacteria bacterium]
MAEALVLDGQALAHLLLGGDLGRTVRETVRSHPVHVTDQAQLDVVQELLRRRDGGGLQRPQFELHLARLLEAPFIQHRSRELLADACRRPSFRLGDALAIELSERLEAPLVTTSSGLAGAWPRSWLVTVPKR